MRAGFESVKPKYEHPWRTHEEPSNGFPSTDGTLHLHLVYLYKVSGSSCMDSGLRGAINQSINQSINQ